MIKGSMLEVKKILGFALLLIAIGFIFNIQEIQDIIMNQPIISMGVLIASAYFLIISGRQNG